MKTMRVICAVCCLFALAFLTSPALSQTVLVEAEGFNQHGGWSVDQQFMDQMGSPFLLAHGLGEPVEDARTTVAFPTAGTYRVLVRTRDWVGPWNAPGAPGKFQLIVNDKSLKTVFGTEGDQWHWQDGGTVEIPGGDVRLAIHDLTGFDGRCDAIVFTRDSDFTPPNSDPEMADFRRRLLGLPGEARGRRRVRFGGGGRRHGGRLLGHFRGFDWA